MGLSNKPTCRKCGTEEGTSVHILGECEILGSLRHSHLDSFFLGPEDIRKRIIGAGARFGVVVKALRYKPADRGFDS